MGVIEFFVNSKKPDVAKEVARYSSQRMRILTMLKSNKWVTNIDLQRIAFNYTMRISELRKDGHIILAQYEKPGVWSYHYQGRRDD